MEINPLTIWTNKKNGKKYAVVYIAQVKIENGDWMPSVTYQDVETGMTFTRDKATFILKFAKAVA